MSGRALRNAMLLSAPLWALIALAGVGLATMLGWL